MVHKFNHFHHLISSSFTVKYKCQQPFLPITLRYIWKKILREKLLYLPGTKSTNVAAIAPILLSFSPVTQEEVSSLLIKAQRKTHFAVDLVLPKI